MHTATRPVGLRPASSNSEEKPRRRWRRWVGALLLLLLMVGVVWAVRPDPHLARARELQQELANGKNLSPDDRKAKFQELRDQMKHLNADQKWELSAPMREKQKAEMDRYFAMSPKEKTRYLDERIDQSEKMRKEWEKKAGQGKSGQAGPGKAGGGFPGGGSPVGFGGSNGKQRSSEEIEKRRKESLNRTTPEERAHMDQFRKDMNDRRKQRGLPVR
jgi:uncharacterized membrane protein YgcG